VKARTGVEGLMCVRVVDTVRFAFGQVEWGGPHIAVPVLAGAVVFAQRIRCLPKGSEVGTLLTSDPTYVHALDGTLVEYRIVGGDKVRETVLDLATWQAWFGAVGVTDVPPQR
jgi:hypothetical protein